MEGEIEDVIPVGEYEMLMKRIRRSERLNSLLFFSIMAVTFLAFIAIGLHTYRYEKRLQRVVSEFKRDVQVVAANQNAAIQDLNQVVLNRDWINYQRLSLKQLQNFYELTDFEAVSFGEHAQNNGVGGK